MKSIHSWLCAATIFLTAGPTAFAQSQGALPRSDAANEQRSPVQVNDLYLLDGPAASAISPIDSDVAVYERIWFDRATRSERHSLWIVENDAANGRPLESGEPDGRSPVFSPDGNWIAFRSTRLRPEGFSQTPPVHPASDPATDIWLIRVAGGSAIPLAGAEKPYGRAFGDPFYSRLAFSPDGKRLAFVADDGSDLTTLSEKQNDVQVVRDDHGEGYTGYGPAQIWVAWLEEEPGAAAASRIERLTNDQGWYGDPQWAADGASVVVHANLAADAESVRFAINSKNYDLWQLHLSGGRRDQLTAGPGAETSPRFSPDGTRIAYLSCPRRGPHTDVFNLTIYDLETNSSATAFDHHNVETWDPGDPAPIFPLPDNCWDGNSAVVYQAANGVHTPAVRVDLLREADLAVAANASEGGAVSRFERDLEIRRRLLPAADPFMKDRAASTTHVFNWQAPDGLPLDGLVSVPHQSIAEPPYKLILHPHGGPHSRSTLAFNFTVEALCARGYLVFQPNFRGSLGYGKKFLDADRQDFGGADMRDIVAGIESLEVQGVISKTEQYVYGVSYGGFMASWLAGHTDRFKAVAVQNAVTDLNMMWGLSDIQSYTEWEFDARPTSAPQRYWRHSPVAYAAQVKSPVLILHSADDRRCPLPMGVQLYRSLRSHDVETQMVVYPREGHQIKEPQHRIDVLERVLAWFEAHP